MELEPLAGAPRQFLGLDVGGTKTALILGDASGRVLRRTEFPSNAERGFESMFRDLVAALRDAMGASPNVCALGVSIGGPLDSESGTVLGPPHLPGWTDVPLRLLLEQATGLPTRIEHDAKACAIAEWRFGAGRGKQHLVFLTAGTGLGAGIILNGRLYRGAGDAAGEVGHWRIAADGPEVYGKRGSWEGYASGAGIAALARLRFPTEFGPATTTADVAAAARRGHAGAQEVLRESGEALGRGLALLVDLLAPEVIVLGSLAWRLPEPWLGSARAVVAREALPAHAQDCAIVASELGDGLPDLAALAVAHAAWEAHA